MEFRQDGDLSLIHVHDPNVYYCSVGSGGVICFFIEHQPFRMITYGQANHNNLKRYVESFEAKRRDTVAKTNSASHSTSANVIADVSGLITSFVDINSSLQKNFRLASKRTLSSVNAELRRRIDAKTTAVHDMIGPYPIFYERTNKLHGVTIVQLEHLTYMAVFFEGKPLADMWFDKQEQLLSTRCFNNDGLSIPVPNNQSTHEWFNYTYDSNDDVITIGTNECDISLATHPGDRVACGDFTIRIITKNQARRENPNRVIRRNNFGSDALITVNNIEGAWASTDNLNMYLRPYDDMRKKICNVLYSETKRW